MFAATGAVGIEEILVDSEVALGKAREVSCESWLVSDRRESEYTEAARDDLKELKYESASIGEAGAGALAYFPGESSGSSSSELLAGMVSSSFRVSSWGSRVESFCACFCGLKANNLWPAIALLCGLS